MTSITPTSDQSMRWGTIWSLVRPYWTSEEKWRAWALLTTIVAMTLGMVYLSVLFNEWNRNFYNALESKNYLAFKEQLWRFSYLAFIYIGVAIYKIYLGQALEMRWRAWMTKQYLGKWLAHRAFYRIEYTHISDNPDQRIAEDLGSITSGTLSLCLGLLSSVVTLISFFGILWSISGPLSFAWQEFSVTIPGYMVWFAIGYAGIGSLLIAWLGKPLVHQNFEQQRFEANFRFGLIRIREYAEAIAFHRGEQQEQTQSNVRFEQVRKNWWNIMRINKRLNAATTCYEQFAIIFPILVGAPRFFSGAITLGGLTQIASAFGHVQHALSWFIQAFSSLASWKASINRLAGFHAAIDALPAAHAQIQPIYNNVGALLMDQVCLRLPSEHLLNEPFSATVEYGQRILVSGPSGCGKSTLFRAIAGIWPYGSGTIEMPQTAKVLFVPQKNYLPIGTLRAAVAYPEAENTYPDLAITHYLDLCRLEHLKESLDQSDNWNQRLSPGEQQRIAFVHILLSKPNLLFLDEATSALDTEIEQILYKQLITELPHAIMISIAHRDTLKPYHNKIWHFKPMADIGSGTRSEIVTSSISTQ